MNPAIGEGPDGPAPGPEDPLGSAGFYVMIASAAALLLICGLMAGLHVAFVNLDMTHLQVVAQTGTAAEKAAVRILQPLMARNHLVTFSLVLLHAITDEALPLVIERVSNEYIAVALSVPLILLFGEIVPHLLFGGKPVTFASKLAPFMWVTVALVGVVTYPLAELAHWMSKGHVEETNKELRQYRRNELRAFLRLHAATRPGDSSSSGGGGGGGGGGDDDDDRASTEMPMMRSRESTHQESPSHSSHSSHSLEQERKSGSGGGSAVHVRVVDGEPSSSSSSYSHSSSATHAKHSFLPRFMGGSHDSHKHGHGHGPRGSPTQLGDEDGHGGLTAPLLPIPEADELNGADSGFESSGGGGDSSASSGAGGSGKRQRRWLSTIAHGFTAFKRAGSHGPHGPHGHGHGSEQAGSGSSSGGYEAVDRDTPPYSRSSAGTPTSHSQGHSRRGSHDSGIEGGSGGGEDGSKRRGAEADDGGGLDSTLGGRMAGRGGGLTEHEIRVLEGTLSLTAAAVSRRMVSYDKVFALSAETVISHALLNAVANSAHSRIPVYTGGDRRAVIGILLVKLLLRNDLTGLDAVVASGEEEEQEGEGGPRQPKTIGDLPLLRPMILHPRTSMLDALRMFEAQRAHLALVCESPPLTADFATLPHDAGLTGLVTLEDCLLAVLNLRNPVAKAHHGSHHGSKHGSSHGHHHTHHQHRSHGSHGSSSAGGPPGSAAPTGSSGAAAVPFRPDDYDDRSCGVIIPGSGSMPFGGGADRDRDRDREAEREREREEQWYGQEGDGLDSGAGSLSSSLVDRTQHLMSDAADMARLIQMTHQAHAAAAAAAAASASAAAAAAARNSPQVAPAAQADTSTMPDIIGDS